MKHKALQTGDLVLCYTPQPKLGEANRFHLQRELGPFEIAECVMDITYRVRKVGAHSKRDPQAVHFNNLWLYKERQEESMEDAPQGGSKDHKWVLLKLGELESVEPDTVISTIEEEVTRVGANDELPSEVVNIPGESEYRSFLAWLKWENSDTAVNMIRYM